MVGWESNKKLTPNRSEKKTSQDKEQDEKIQVIRRRLIKVIKSLKKEDSQWWSSRFVKDQQNLDDLQKLFEAYNGSSKLASEALNGLVSEVTLRNLMKAHRPDFYKTHVLDTITERKQESLSQRPKSNKDLNPRTAKEVKTIIEIETKLDNFLRKQLIEAKGDKIKMKKLNSLLESLPDQAVEIFKIATKINQEYDAQTLKLSFEKWCEKHKIEYPKN